MATEMLLNAVVARACNLAKAKFGGVDSDDTEVEVENAKQQLHDVVMEYAEMYLEDQESDGEAG